MPDVAVAINANFILAFCGVLTVTAGIMRSVYRAMRKYVDNQDAVGTLEHRIANVESDVKVIKTAVTTLVADGKTNGGTSAKDQNNRIERKLDKLLGGSQ